MKNYDFSTYISPFTWRYSSKEMRYIFSEKHKYELWRRIWVALAEIQCKSGLVSQAELDDLKKQEKNINIDRILEIEKETRHDVVAAIKEFAEKTKIGGGKIHLGSTSMDITDNADILRIKEGLAIVEKKQQNVLLILQNLIQKYAGFPCIGYTHLQPAESTTVGYRLAFYAQDLLNNLIQIKQITKTLKGKGFKGAVGTGASYTSLLKDKQTDTEKFDNEIMKLLSLEPVLISNQTYPRQQDFNILNTLAGIGASCAKFAGDLRILQSPMFGEWSEPFGKKQVGSSAMPFKKNPVTAENICSLARYISNLPQIAWENASLSYLERTLDDSANRRLIIAESFLATDQILNSLKKILSGLIINEKRIIYNLNLYAPFAACEAILIEAVKKGADRQEIHEVIRNISMIAWGDIQEGRSNPMEQLLMSNLKIKKYLGKNEIMKWLDIKYYIGNAPERALKLIKTIRNQVKYEK